RHRRPIHLGQDQVWKKRMEIEVLQPREQRQVMPPVSSVGPEIIVVRRDAKPAAIEEQLRWRELLAQARVELEIPLQHRIDRHGGTTHRGTGREDIAGPADEGPGARTEGWPSGIPHELPVPAVSTEELVSSIAGQYRDDPALPNEARQPVRREGGH